MRAPDALLGKRVRCPGCQSVLAIPAQAPTPAAAAAPPTKPPAPRPAAPPPDEFGIAPAHELPTAPVPISVRNALAELEARNQPRPQFSVPGERTAKPAAAAEPLTPPRHNYRYLVFVLALLPLGWWLLSPPFDPLAQAASQAEAESSESTGDVANVPSVPSEDDLIHAVEAFTRDGKLPGAHLSRGSWIHWIYAFVAAAVFLGVMRTCLPLGNANVKQLLIIGLVTSTGGVIFLLGLQIAGVMAWTFPLFTNIILILFVLAFRLLGFAYYATENPDAPFLLLFLGFTFGVGLCEELTKALPVLFRGRDGQESDWRGAGARGFASGVGFGVAEGIHYSSNYYNGVDPFSIYLVRFASCVALHAVWTYAVGIMIWRYRDELSEEEDWRYMSLTLLKVLAVPMTLHGLYNTTLTKEMPLLALATALASFGWLALQIELVTRRERSFYADLNRRRPRTSVA